MLHAYVFIDLTERQSSNLSKQQFQQKTIPSEYSY